jgi:hypothetical protein
MTTKLVEPVPLFIDSWESRMRAACLAYNRAGAQIQARYHAIPKQNPSKSEIRPSLMLAGRFDCSPARWVNELLLSKYLMWDVGREFHHAENEGEH